jgi:hypothetical protein
MDPWVRVVNGLAVLPAYHFSRFMRRLGIGLLGLLALAQISTARADSQINFYLDDFNLLSGIGAAYLINKPGSAAHALYCP